MIDFEDEFPEDEFDYYEKLMDQSTAIGIAMIECKDPEQSDRLVKRYEELQELIDNVSFGNVYDD